MSEFQEVIIKSDPPEVYQCETCRDAGWLTDPKDPGQVTRCACKLDEDRKLKSVTLLKSCEIPPLGESMRFETYKIPPGNKLAYDSCKRIAETNKGWVTLCGNCDRGKTHLAIAACHRAIELGCAAKYIYVPEMLDQLRATFNGQGNFEQKFEFYKSVPLLVLDDLGAGKWTDWGMEKLELLIDSRYMRCKPLIVTSNLGIQDLIERVPRIASRLLRSENATVVDVSGTEYMIFKADRRGNV